MAIPDDGVHSGRCLCGGIHFETTGPPTIVAQCCCVDCQRLTGTGHSTGAMYASDRVRLTGEVTEFRLTSEAGNEVTRVFCPKCGSPILGRNSGMPGFVTLSLGVFDDSSAFDPQVAIFTRSRRPWDALSDAVDCFAAQPEWKPAEA
ncbi:MAG TPA: GFA family protein [Myxococcota bacterium]|jgi:hypothetical protein